MNRREFIKSVTGSTAAIVVAAPALAAPIDYPHERLSDVWNIMKRTPGGPVAMRHAVEREFGAGILRFASPHSAVVLLDTWSIDYWEERESFKSFAAAKVKIVKGIYQQSEESRQWHQAYPIRCI